MTKVICINCNGIVVRMKGETICLNCGQLHLPFDQTIVEMEDEEDDSEE